jgi:hypothetical protein
VRGGKIHKKAAQLERTAYWVSGFSVLEVTPGFSQPPPHKYAVEFKEKMADIPAPPQSPQLFDITCRSGGL